MTGEISLVLNKKIIRTENKLPIYIYIYIYMYIYIYVV